MRGRDVRTLEWRGIKCRVTHDPDHRGSEGWSRLQITVIAPFDYPLPVSGTAQAVREIDEDEINAAGGVEAFVLAWMDRDSATPRYARALARWQQTDLFER